MKYQLAIFDLDGTLLNTLEDLADSTNYIMRQYGHPERTLTEVRSFVGNGIRKLLERSAPKGTSPEEIDRMFEQFKEHYGAHCADKTKPYDGIMELLDALKKQGVKLAVVSNKADYAVKSLCEQYFPETFDEAVGERTGIAGKPAPDTVHEVLRNLQMEKSRAVYIGDSEVDVQTARNAELDCIAVDWGFRDKEVLEEAGAETIVSIPEKILSMLLTETINHCNRDIFTIKPLTSELNAEYLDFFDNRAFTDGNPNGPCYCTSPNQTEDDIKQMVSEFKELGVKETVRKYAVELLNQNKIRGYLAFDGDLSIGWCNAADMDSYVGFVPAFARENACGKTMSIVCFEIAPEYRGKGIASAFIERVCSDAKAKGYAVVEGYARFSDKRNEFDFQGPVRLFEKAGFMEAARKDGQIIMRKMI